MLHAAAMLLGLSILWLLATQRFNSVDDLAAAVLVAATCTLAAARAGGVGDAFARAPRAMIAAVRRAGAVLRASIETTRAGLAADIKLTPALVRVRTRGRGASRAAFANMISATPGMAVVETDLDGLLVHVLNEDNVDAVELGRLERVAGVEDQGAMR